MYNIPGEAHGEEEKGREREREITM
jgi:hypothetical protein